MDVPAKAIAAVADHGGSLGRARSLFPHAPEPWVDLSTGINPHSYPLFDLPATALTRLPEFSSAGRLQTAAAVGFPALRVKGLMLVVATLAILGVLDSAAGANRGRTDFPGQCTTGTRLSHC